MTDPAIIAASYAAERNYSHNLDDVIDPSGAVLAIGTEKVDTTTLKDRSPENNNATIHGPMPTEGFIRGRRFDGIDDFLDCDNDGSLDTPDAITIEIVIKFKLLPSGHADAYSFTFSKSNLMGIMLHRDLSNIYFKLTDIDDASHYIYFNETEINPMEWYHILCTYNGTIQKLYLNTVEMDDSTWTKELHTYADTIKIGNNSNCLVAFTQQYDFAISESNITQHFNTLARLPFWSVNYTDYPDNVTEYTDNLPYSSSIISSGTFKVDDDKLQCVSAGTITYRASYEFDGSEYIKVEIGGVEYAGTGTITQGNTTVSVAQGSNKVTIEMGTGDTIEGEIGIQFRKCV